MCEKSGDAIDRLHCEVARDLWSPLCNLFGVNWVILRRNTSVPYWEEMCNPHKVGSS
jgi:hypothetical protein